MSRELPPDRTLLMQQLALIGGASFVAFFALVTKASRFAIDRLDGNVVPALCKEDAALWRPLGLRFDGCHCLLGGVDPLVDEAPEDVRSLLGAA